MIKGPEVIESQVAIDAESISKHLMFFSFKENNRRSVNFGKNGSEWRRSPQGSQTQPGLRDKRRLVGEVTKYVD